MKRGAPIKRTPMKRKSPRKTKAVEFSPAVRAQLEARAGGWCEVAVPGCAGRGHVGHHRLMRSQGGRGALDNGLWVCRACHDYVHAHPTESYERGWLLRGT